MRIVSAVLGFNEDPREVFVAGLNEGNLGPGHLFLYLDRFVFYPYRRRVLQRRTYLTRGDLNERGKPLYRCFQLRRIFRHDGNIKGEHVLDEQPAVAVVDDAPRRPYLERPDLVILREVIIVVTLYGLEVP